MKFLIVLILVAFLLAVFVVLPAMAQPVACGSTYIVQPGDYMRLIARNCGVNYADLLNMNPQVQNPDLIYPGQVLNLTTGNSIQTSSTTIIPVTGSTNTVQVLVPVTGGAVNAAQPGVPTISVTPAIGVIGSTATIAASGFQANQPVEIGFGMLGSTYYQLATTTTDGNGSVFGQYQIPNWPNIDHRDGQYIFLVDELNQPSISAFSNPFALTGTGNVSGNPVPVTVPVASGHTYYMVQQGDTLAGIAEKYHTSAAALLALNPALGTSGAVFPGELILLPLP